MVIRIRRHIDLIQSQYDNGHNLNVFEKIESLFRVDPMA